MTSKEFVRHMIRGWKEKKKGFTVHSLYDSRDQFMQLRDAYVYTSYPWNTRYKLPLRNVKDHNYCAVGVVMSEAQNAVIPSWTGPGVLDGEIAPKLPRIVELSNESRSKTEAIRKIRQYLGV